MLRVIGAMLLRNALQIKSNRGGRLFNDRIWKVVFCGWGISNFDTIKCNC